MNIPTQCASTTASKESGSRLAHLYTLDSPTERGGSSWKLDRKAVILGSHELAELVRLLAFTEPPPRSRHLTPTGTVTALTFGHVVV